MKSGIPAETLPTIFPDPEWDTAKVTARPSVNAEEREEGGSEISMLPRVANGFKDGPQSAPTRC